ncbi:26S protease regulatory subunit 10B, partial [Orchesella cincta]
GKLISGNGKQFLGSPGPRFSRVCVALKLIQFVYGLLASRNCIGYFAQACSRAASRTNEAIRQVRDDLKALQSVGHIVGEVLKQLTEDKFIVKATNGPRYVGLLSFNWIRPS